MVRISGTIIKGGRLCKKVVFAALRGKVSPFGHACGATPFLRKGVAPQATEDRGVN